ncbi:MAG: hypothetical protein K0R51_2615 [Cytophagaceae bacterium]|jgi:hypothetical protein|nr:hypothetical protein [Cytophagaceae bacterium]
MRYLLVLLVLSWNTVTTSKEIMLLNSAGSKSVYFRFNSFHYSNADHAKEMKNEYERLKQLMDENPQLEVELHGYQNNQERNKLADKRALKVKQDLIRIGINSNRLGTIAEPPLIITDSMDEIEKWKTQRVDFLPKH